ncbi:MAG TPA: amylo-alpha-1,6-glucosidase [Terriglobia bacterium]|nr:amylo-alpha-1,6-glucosidase [Terriglobia bacterium]
MPWERTAPAHSSDPVLLLTREWLVTNALGGYASASVSGACTRRYHGLLIAALPKTLGRIVMLSHFAEEIALPDETVIDFGGEELSEEHLNLHAAEFLTEFRLEAGLPVWRYDIRGCTIEKRLVMPHLQNTVYISYRLLCDKGLIRLRLRPAMHFREHEAPVSLPLEKPYTVRAIGDRYEIAADANIPPLRFRLYGPQAGFVLEGGRFKTIFYRVEQSRGYEFRGPLWNPGFFRTTLRNGETFTVVASTEPWEKILALDPPEAFQKELARRRKLVEIARPEVTQGWPAELVLAADQFLITPNTRAADAARAQAAGDDVRTVIAGYHWFTDWGRDTMISLEGLTLTTGRHAEAGYILRTFAHYIRDGLIPNMFPEGEQSGLYHTADATLWYFHAIEKYLAATGDRETLQLLLPKLTDIIDHHVRGTRFGIGVDPTDGLLRQGEEGYQLTWMDAKVGDWVVTPRRGKTVEINALWYNALRLMETWTQQDMGDEEAAKYADLAARAYESFNRRFWFDAGGYLYDLVDSASGNDSSLRPNQLFAFSLTHPILDPLRWKQVLDVVQKFLLTPYGLRSLAPGHPDYKAQYYGDLRARDAAYHQGTVWAWLIGPFIDAWLRVYPDDFEGARRLLEGFKRHLSDACIGSISEVFDAAEPFTPRGCVAQAWSVAEVLRCWAKTDK